MLEQHLIIVEMVNKYLKFYLIIFIKFKKYELTEQLYYFQEKKTEEDINDLTKNLSQVSLRGQAALGN